MSPASGEVPAFVDITYLSNQKRVGRDVATHWCAYFAARYPTVQAFDRLLWGLHGPLRVIAAIKGLMSSVLNVTCRKYLASPPSLPTCGLVWALHVKVGGSGLAWNM